MNITSGEVRVVHLDGVKSSATYITDQRRQSFPCTKLLITSILASRAPSIRWKILFRITRNSQWRMEQHFPKFPQKRDISWGIQKFLNFRSIWLSKFRERSVKWFVFWKVNSFWIFWNSSLEISVPFVLESKYSEFLVEWKAPLVWLTKTNVNIQVDHKDRDQRRLN